MVSMTEPQTLLKADDVSIVVKAEKVGKALRVTCLVREDVRVRRCAERRHEHRQVIACRYGARPRVGLGVPRPFPFRDDLGEGAYRVTRTPRAAPAARCYTSRRTHP